MSDVDIIVNKNVFSVSLNKLIILIIITIIMIIIITESKQTRLKKCTYLFVSVGLICHVLYLEMIILSKMSILYCLVLLNSVPF